MPSPNATIIDAYFGDDTFDWAQWLQMRTRMARKRYDGSVRNNFGVYDDGLSWRVDLCEGISADVDDAFRMVANGQKVDKYQFKNVLDLFETAVDCIELELDMFDGMIAVGIATGFLPFVKMFPYRELARELEAYKKALSRLQTALEKAKTEKNEAYIDKGLDILGGIVTFAFPEIALAKEMALGFGSLFADSRLGPQDPDASKIVRTTASTLKEPIAKIAKFSDSMKKVAGAAGKVNAVYDVVSWDEIDMAKARLKEIEEAIKEEKALHKRIVEDIWLKWAIRLETFKKQLEQANKGLEETRGRAQELRDILREHQEMVNYKGAVKWRVVQ